MNRQKAYFIDVQGTLIDDAKRMPVRGSIEFIDSLNLQKIPYMVITNNTKHSSEDFLSYLNSIGLNIKKEHYLDPLMLLQSKIAKDQGLAAYGTKEFLDVVVSMGYTLDYENPQTVLVSIKNDYSSEEYASIIDFLLKGAKLVGMHETTIYAKNSKRYPGVGAILKMLSFATSVSYEVVGKPSDNFYAEALKRIKEQMSSIAFEDITIISDDVKGDLTGAAIFGMKTVFVLSGKYTKAEEIIPLLKEDEKPDFIFEDMQDVMERL
ncbi:HAD-IIA family hydrolase [Sulfurimonas sp. HSL-1716]|uniref:HAD-IIA family hydrolase n=1 Tax=Hydrocurvibacter sulfurireducens TaxID=3131937 RepID=UPI0031F810B0